MYSAKQLLQPVAVLISLSVSLGCDTDDGRDYSSDDRQLATCNESYEAENANSARDWNEDSRHLKSGSYMDAEGKGASIMWRFDAPQSEDYRLSAIYANGDDQGDDRPVDVFVNGEWAGKMTFESTDDWSKWRSEGLWLDLEEGPNEIEFVVSTNQGGPNINYIDFESEALCG